MGSRQLPRASAHAAMSSPAASVAPERPSTGTPAQSGGSSREGISCSVHQSPVGPSHGILGLAHAATHTSSGEHESPTKKARKERSPNWNSLEVRALVEAKRLQHVHTTSSTDGRQLMASDANKWLRVSVDVMKAKVSTTLRDGPACKSKWNQLIPEYKRIADFVTRSGTEDRSYWSMTAAQKKSSGLPRSFAQDIFFLIHAWYGEKPDVTTALATDWLSKENVNCDDPTSASQEQPHVQFTDEMDDEPFDFDAAFPDTHMRTAPTNHPTAPVNTSRPPSSAAGPSVAAPVNTSRPPSSAASPSIAATASPAAPSRSAIPVDVTPVLISSEDTGEDSTRRRPANTGVRRKAIFGHALIAEATRFAGESLTVQMKDIAQSSRDVEESKIDLQQRLFELQMKYEEERDLRLQENARLVNVNAKLSIEKQGDVVQSLTQLTAVIGAGLDRARFPTGHDSQD